MSQLLGGEDEAPVGELKVEEGTNRRFERCK